MLMLLVIGAAFIVAPFYIRFEQIPVDMRYYKDWFFQFLTILMIILPSKQKVPKNLIYIFMALIAFAFFNQWLTASRLVRYQFNSFSFGIIFLIQMIRHNPGREKILNLMSTSCLIGSIWVIMENLAVGPYDIISNIRGMTKIFTGTPDLPPGFLANQMVTGNFFALLLPSMMRKKWVYFAFLPGIAIGLLRGATAIVPGLIILVSFLLFKNRIKILRVLSAVIMSAAILLPLYVRHLTGFLAAHGRADVWSNCLTIHNGLDIFVGKGLGWFPDKYPRIFHHAEFFQQAHNEFIECYVAFGLIGLGLFIYLLYLMWKSNDKIVQLALPSICIVIAGGFPLHIAPLALIVIVYFIIAIEPQSQGDRDGTHSNRKIKHNNGK